MTSSASLIRCGLLADHVEAKQAVELKVAAPPLKLEG